jgi:hypothetical protein
MKRQIVRQELTVFQRKLSTLTKRKQSRGCLLRAESRTSRFLGHPTTLPMRPLNLFRLLVLLLTFAFGRTSGADELNDVIAALRKRAAASGSPMAQKFAALMEREAGHTFNLYYPGHPLMIDLTDAAGQYHGWELKSNRLYGLMGEMHLREVGSLPHLSNADDVLDCFVHESGHFLFGVSEKRALGFQHRMRQALGLQVSMERQAHTSNMYRALMWERWQPFETVVAGRGGEIFGTTVSAPNAPAFSTTVDPYMRIPRAINPISPELRAVKLPTTPSWGSKIVTGLRYAGVGLKILGTVAPFALAAFQAHLESDALDGPNIMGAPIQPDLGPYLVRARAVLGATYAEKYPEWMYYMGTAGVPFFPTFGQKGEAYAKRWRDEYKHAVWLMKYDQWREKSVVEIKDGKLWIMNWTWDGRTYRQMPRPFPMDYIPPELRE